MPELKSNIENVRVKCCLWLLIGFAGAVMVATGLPQLFDGASWWPSALARVLSGGALAAASWRCGRAALEQGRRASSEGTGAHSELAMRGVSSEAGRAHDAQDGHYSAALGPQTR